MNNKNLIIIGSENNVINIVEIKVNNKGNIKVDKKFQILKSSSIMLHSCIISNNILYILDSFNSVMIRCNLYTNSYCECCTGKDPRHLCKYLDNIYITNFESDSVSIVDADSCTQTGIIKVCMKPHDIISNNDNKIYVSCYEENCILEYDITNYNKKYYYINGKPMHLIIDENRLYVLSYLVNENMQSEINIINLETGVTDKTFFIEEITNNFIIDKDNNRLMVLSIEKGRLYIIDINTGEIIKQIHLKGYLEDVSVDNKYIYIANSNKSSVTLIDKITYEKINTIYFDFQPLYIKIV
ncbi:hypothetical protein JYG23_05445 [Sedimentibacter sp. zth1]|uniref:YncE family protein n=1 Tax=Sedimentibacter sp. zth1 TaxID=2816908 RepID=UPI001A927F4F|nr:hypothetical protein [Sedimentibacter sp. zth1]QSX06891.1 hypothetical protein JYG23_05445 [Sedimentibacter sp. zth1]